MATLHVGGTQLEPKAISAPLNRAFLISLGVVFFIAMHFFMPNPGGSGLALSFNPTTWLAFSFSISLGLYQLATNRMLRYSKLTIGLFFCCLLLSVPLLYTNSKLDGASDRLLGLWAGFVFLIVLQQFQFSNRHKQRLLWFVIIAVVIQALFGFSQYLLLEPGNIFGYNTQSNRPYGVFQQPNVMASFLATGLVLSGYLITTQPHKYNKKWSEVSLLYIVPALTTPLLIALASRTGWLGAILGTLCILPYLYRFSTLKRGIGWCLSVILGLVLGAILIQSEETGEFVTTKTDLQTPRTYTFPQALDMLIERPFTGYGYGKFESQYILYTARQHQLNSHYPSGLPAMDHPHNELLLWGVEGGLVPVIGIILAAMFVLSRIYTAKKGTRLALFSLFIPIVLHSQLEYPFYHSAIHWITFIILIYWIDQRTSKYKTQSFSIVSKSLLRIASLIIPVITSLYMLSALHSNYVLTQFEQSKPKNPEILNGVTNPVVWKDRFDWNIYSTYLNIGLYTQDKKLIEPYISWSLDIIKEKPRPAFYTNLILAYQGLNDPSRAEQVRAEASFLFPNNDFSTIQYTPPEAISSSDSSQPRSSVN